MEAKERNEGALAKEEAEAFGHSHFGVVNRIGVAGYWEREMVDMVESRQEVVEADR